MRREGRAPLAGLTISCATRAEVVHDRGGGIAPQSGNASVRPMVEAQMRHAWLLGLLGVGCLWAGPGRRPQILEAPTVATPPPPPTGEDQIVGFMCPTAAAGRPALTALAVHRQGGWSDDPRDLAAILARGTAPLLVFAFDGRRAGRFTMAGPAAEQPTRPRAIGGYAGALPCADEATTVECAAVTAGCGLALTDDLNGRHGTGCIAAETLYVDLDGDGRSEAVRLADLAALPDEVIAFGAPAPPTCTARFALAAGHDVDLLGALDLDGDGRLELVLAHRAAGGSRIAIYTATTAQRLERLAATDFR